MTTQEPLITATESRLPPEGSRGQRGKFCSCMDSLTNMNSRETLTDFHPGKAKRGNRRRFTGLGQQSASLPQSDAEDLGCLFHIPRLDPENGGAASLAGAEAGHRRQVDLG